MGIDRSQFINTRDLKNKSTELLRKAENGTVFVITRRGKPVATLKAFSPEDIYNKKKSLAYTELKSRLIARFPHLINKSEEELLADFDRISAKVSGFKTWQDMDRALKGDPYGFSR